MKKSFLFEFEDQHWFPAVIREGMTDFLRFIFSRGKLYEPVIPLLVKAISRAQSTRILDLCSGAGGAVEQVSQGLVQYRYTPDILVTDKYPNINAWRFLHHKTKGAISYVDYPVDATQVPDNLTGFRTIFSGFHHFDESAATAILQNAAAAGEGIAIFDGGSKSIWFMLVIILLQPLAFLIGTPFIKPFRWSRIVFTYLLPLIPFCTVWDGVVSVMRLYTVKELQMMAGKVRSVDYSWQAGTVKNKLGMRIAYLIGVAPDKQ